MGKKRIAALFGAALMALPIAASADTGAGVSSSLFISGNGIVHAIHAEITSISGNVISAISRFGSHVLNWSITTDTETKFGGAATSSASLSVGDRVNVSGALTGLGSTISVSADKIRETATSTAKWFKDHKHRGIKAFLGLRLGLGHEKND